MALRNGLRPGNSLAAMSGRQAEKPTFAAAVLGATMQNQIMKSVPDERSRARFTSAIIELVNSSTQLQKCEPASIVSAALRGEGQGLILGHGYYVVPYGSKATYITGFKGYITLAMSTGLYNDIDCLDVREGEYKGRNRRTGKPDVDFTVYETDEEREAQPIIGYYGYFELKDGYFRSEYWSMDKLLKHAEKYSPAFSIEKYMKMVSGEMSAEEFEKVQNGSPWYDLGGGTDRMCRKTVLRSLLNSGFAPLSNEVRNFIANDADVVIEPDAPAAKKTAPDPLKDIIDSTATVKDIPKPSPDAPESPKKDSKAKAEEIPVESQKPAQKRSTAAKEAEDPLKGAMNPPEPQPKEAQAAQQLPDDGFHQGSLFDALTEGR